ncbi:putative retrotransposon protein [Tanacetum coccineum]
MVTQNHQSYQKFPNQLYKLKRFIYGLKQASSQWNKRFDDEIKKFGFSHNRDEPCVYVKASGSYVTFLILYVDDILIMGNNIPMLQDVKSYLGRCFAMKDLEEATYILGIKIYRDRSKRLIGLCQSAYIEKILKRFYMKNSKHMFLVYGGDTKRELRVSCYTNVGYLTDADDMKSQTGYVFILNGGVAVWIRKFIYGLGVVPAIEEPINMYCDNTRAIAIAKDHGVTKGARHFRVKVHYLRETIEMGDVGIEKVDTYDNLADLFMKALAFPEHSELTRKIGMIPASSLM